MTPRARHGRRSAGSAATAIGPGGRSSSTAPCRTGSTSLASSAGRRRSASAPAGPPAGPPASTMTSAPRARASPTPASCRPGPRWPPAMSSAGWSCVPPSCRRRSSSSTSCSPGPPPPARPGRPAIRSRWELPGSRARAVRPPSLSRPTTAPSRASTCARARTATGRPPDRPRPAAGGLARTAPRRRRLLQRLRARAERGRRPLLRYPAVRTQRGRFAAACGRARRHRRRHNEDARAAAHGVRGDARAATRRRGRRLRARLRAAVLARRDPGSGRGRAASGGADPGLPANASPTPGPTPTAPARRGARPRARSCRTASGGTRRCPAPPAGHRPQRGCGHSSRGTGRRGRVRAGR